MYLRTMKNSAQSEIMKTLVMFPLMLPYCWGRYRQYVMAGIRATTWPFHYIIHIRPLWKTTTNKRTIDVRLLVPWVPWHLKHHNTIASRGLRGPSMGPPSCREAWAFRTADVSFFQSNHTWKTTQWKPKFIAKLYRIGLSL